MKTLILKSIILILAIITISWAVLFKVPVNKDHYLMAFNKKEQLLKTMVSPKIILAGNSSFAFGVNSKKIEDALEMPVVNLGIHGGFRLKFLLNSLKDNIKPGDIVIFMLEYSNFTKQLTYGETALFQAALYNNSMFTYFEFKHYIHMLKSSPALLKIRFKELISRSENQHTHTSSHIYNAVHFNAYGDYTGHLGLQPKDKLIGLLHLDPETQFNKTAIEMLNNFYRHDIQKNNAHCILIFPCIPLEHITEKKLNTLDKLHITLNNDLQFAVIGHPFDSIIPGKFFFDTIYHLNTEGREWNTNRIIHLLNTAFTEKSLSTKNKNIEVLQFKSHNN